MLTKEASKADAFLDASCLSMTKVFFFVQNDIMLFLFFQFNGFSMQIV
jgi:hypothetical protein